MSILLNTFVDRSKFRTREVATLSWSCVDEVNSFVPSLAPKPRRASATAAVRVMSIALANKTASGVKPKPLTDWPPLNVAMWATHVRVPAGNVASKL